MSWSLRWGESPKWEQTFKWQLCLEESPWALESSGSSVDAIRPDQSVLELNTKGDQIPIWGCCFGLSALPSSAPSRLAILFILSIFSLKLSDGKLILRAVYVFLEEKCIFWKKLSDESFFFHTRLLQRFASFSKARETFSEILSWICFTIASSWSPEAASHLEQPQVDLTCPLLRCPCESSVNCHFFHGCHRLFPDFPSLSCW